MSEGCDTTDLKAPNMYSAPQQGLALFVCLLAVHVLSCHCFAVVSVAQIFPVLFLFDFFA